MADLLVQCPTIQTYIGLNLTFGLLMLQVVLVLLFYLLIKDGTDKLRLYINNDKVFVDNGSGFQEVWDGGTDFFKGSWHTIAFKVYDDATADLWVDGTEEVTGLDTVADATSAGEIQLQHDGNSPESSYVRNLYVTENKPW